MNMTDYDGRTPLHLAACEGRANVVNFFLDIARVIPNPKDRSVSTHLFHQINCRFNNHSEHAMCPRYKVNIAAMKCDHKRSRITLNRISKKSPSELIHCSSPIVDAFIFAIFYPYFAL